MNGKERAVRRGGRFRIAAISTPDGFRDLTFESLSCIIMIMRKLKKSALFAVLLAFFAAVSVFAQQRFPLGAILDEESYNSLPKKASLATRAYEGLPKSFSLKQYAPLPGDQTDYGTCVAWASAYAARTISESVALSRRNQTESTRNAFSPVYVYRNIRPDDPECVRGAQIYWALDLMKETGAVKILDIERSVDFPRVDLSYYNGSRKYPIADYVTLFSDDDKTKQGLVSRRVKKSLVEGKPVIIGMNTPDSFLEASNVWQPAESPGHYYGGHAMCVIGYDDDKNGGAFEIINSWGRKWGNGGFIWIPYKAFTDFVLEGYEMIENLATYSDSVKFSGFGRIEILDPEGVKPARLDPDPSGVYKTTEALGEGTEFRLVAGSDESAYMYAFAASLPSALPAEENREGGFYSPIQLFPQAGVSPLLTYRNNAVILPGEDKTLVLDNIPGMEYFILLYSKQTLDIRSVMRRFENARGTPNERLAAALDGGLLTADKVSYDGKDAAFTAETADARAVAALILAIDHR